MHSEICLLGYAYRNIHMGRNTELCTWGYLHGMHTRGYRNISHSNMGSGYAYGIDKGICTQGHILGDTYRSVYTRGYMICGFLHQCRHFSRIINSMRQHPSRYGVLIPTLLCLCVWMGTLTRQWHRRQGSEGCGKSAPLGYSLPPKAQPEGGVAVGLGEGTSTQTFPSPQ